MTFAIGQFKIDRFYPCLCLKRGFFLLITNKTPFLLTILQSTLLFFIEAFTFMLFLFIN